MKTSNRRHGPSAKDPKIFISYRRDDARGHAVHLHSDLTRHFGADHIFMDTSGIEGGEDFVEVLEARLTTCEVLVAVIGRQWVDFFNKPERSATGAMDWVLVEIATALKQNMPIVPVLVDDANFPAEKDLPAELEGFARLQAVRMRDDQWDHDLARLIRILRRVVKRNWLLLATLTIVSLLAMSYLFFQIATKPLSVKLDASNQNIPQPVAGDELILQAPLVNSAGLLFSREAAPDENLEVTLTNAQLSTKTVNRFRLDARWASTSKTISYNSYSEEDFDKNGNKCATSIQVSLKDGKPIEQLRLQNREAQPGGDYRALQLESVGAELLVQMSSNLLADAEVGTEANGPGCGKLMTTDFGRDPRYGPFNFEAAVSASSPIVFVFRPTVGPLWADDEGFLPFKLGSQAEPGGLEQTPSGLTASAVSLGPNGSVFYAKSVDGKSSLQIESLKVGPKQLLVSVSGEGFVKLNGEDAVGTIERFKRQPGQTMLLLVATATLLVCCWLLLRRLYFARR